MQRLLSAAYVVGIVIALPACADKPRTNADSARDTGMAAMPDMPGMKMGGDSAPRATDGNRIALSAAQVANGGIRWAIPTATLGSTFVEVPGQLVPNEDRTARMAAPAEARVLAVHVSPGDRVSRGAQLVTLQSREASMAHADVAKAEAELSSRRAAAAYAKAARDRAERLLSVKAIPRQEYERAIADDELARAAVSQADAELTRAASAAEQLGVDRETGAMVLRTPVAGVVMARDAVPGAVASAGAPMVTVTDPTSLWLAVSMPEQLAAGVHVGSVLRFSVAALPSDTFVARVQSVSAAFDPATRSLPVRGVVATARGQLRPEMYAKVWVQGSAERAMITVPDAAIQRVEGKPVVFVAQADGKGGAHFMTRHVDVQSAGQGRSAIVAGVSAGEAVVIEGAYAVKAELLKAKMPKMEM